MIFLPQKIFAFNTIEKIFSFFISSHLLKKLINIFFEFCFLYIIAKADPVRSLS